MKFFELKIEPQCLVTATGNQLPLTGTFPYNTPQYTYDVNGRARFEAPLGRSSANTSEHSKQEVPDGQCVYAKRYASQISQGTSQRMCRDNGGMMVKIKGGENMAKHLRKFLQVQVECKSLPQKGRQISSQYWVHPEDKLSLPPTLNTLPPLYRCRSIGRFLGEPEVVLVVLGDGSRMSGEGSL
ncbi:hypothetical protein R3P38DRAFT_2808245 [Favolaschia claudopus]|uniref:Uncharacterized protein n=1 Tax=Favolaschia claudopus TaxID=2862362 RepID=A0AAV9ZFR7_9AGAR